MIDNYTRLLEATAELEDAQAAEEAVRKLIAHLKSAGRIKMLPQIVREFRKIAARRRVLQPKVEVAREEEAAATLRVAAVHGVVVRRAVVNPALICGWRARKGSMLIDRSGKSALVAIYRKVTA